MLKEAGGDCEKLAAMSRAALKDAPVRPPRQDAAGYAQHREALQRRQLTQAAAHLAALLRRVWP